MSPSLSVVADNDLRAVAAPKLETPKPETVAERVRSLQAEARQLAKDHIYAFTAAMSDLERMAAEIAEGGYFRGQYNHASLLIAAGRRDEAVVWFAQAVRTAPPQSRQLIVATCAREWAIDVGPA